MKPVQDFEVNVPRGAEVIAREAGIPDVAGVAIGIKWSKETGWWIEVRGDDNIVRSYRAEQVVVL